jgi:hypothetical protein
LSFQPQSLYTAKTGSKPWHPRSTHLKQQKLEDNIIKKEEGHEKPTQEADSLIWGGGGTEVNK